MENLSSDVTMPTQPLAAEPLLRDVPEVLGYKVLGGVVLYEKLGQGGMGAVFKGRHLRLSVDVAVKVLAPSFSAHEAENEANLQRFLREAHVAAAVTHQNLVRVSDVDSIGALHYLIMDYVDGESAGERMDRKGALDELEALQIVLGAADGVADAHDAGIVHRDIKPDNIMIDTKGRIRVADLGLAKVFDSKETSTHDVTQTQTGIGTPGYMAPEQFMSARSVTPAADVWSLGVTLYAFVTNQLPWDDESIFRLAQLISEDPLPNPRDTAPMLSDGVVEIITRATAKKPEERYRDCAEMASAIRAQIKTLADDDKLPSLNDNQYGSQTAPSERAVPPALTFTNIKMAMTQKIEKPEIATQQTIPIPMQDQPKPQTSTAPGPTAPRSSPTEPTTAMPNPSSNHVGFWLVVAAFVIAVIFGGIWLSAKDGSLNNDVNSAGLNLTDSERQWLKEHPVIRLGVDPGFAPFEYINERGELHGMVAEYLKAFSEVIGSELKVVPDLTWQEAMQGAEDGSIDVLTCIGFSEKRNKLFLLSKPYLTFPRVIIVQKGSKISDLGELKDKKVCVQGSSSHHEILKETTELSPALYSTFRECLIKVSSGKMDATIGNMAVARYWMDELMVTNLAVGGYVDDKPQKLYFGIRRDWGEFLSITNKFLDSIKEQEHMRIKQRWRVR